jgi:hypothetical protein
MSEEEKETPVPEENDETKAPDELAPPILGGSADRQSADQRAATHSAIRRWWERFTGKG